MPDVLKTVASEFCKSHAHCSECPLSGDHPEQCLARFMAEVCNTPEKDFQLITEWSIEQRMARLRARQAETAAENELTSVG